MTSSERPTPVSGEGRRLGDLLEAEALCGNVSGVRPYRNVVLRRTGPWSDTIDALQAHPERNSLRGGAQYLGTTEDGAEVLTYIPGTATEHPVPEMWSEKGGTFVREFYDAVAVFAPLADTWCDSENGSDGPSSSRAHTTHTCGKQNTGRRPRHAGIRRLS